MSLINTLMQPLRAEYMGKFDKNESRPSRYGAYDHFREDSNFVGGIMTQSIIDKVKRSMGNTVTIPVLDAKTVTIGNVRSCTIADDENTSNLVTLTFVTYAFGFTMRPAQHFNNDINYQEDFNRKLNDYLIQFAATLDTAAVNVLETNKNQLWTGLTAYYAEVADALQVTQALKNDFYNNLQAIMETADFYNDIKVISSTSGSPLVRRLDAQGDANSVNEAFQITPYDWKFTNRITNGGGVQSTLYAVDQGSVGFETRIDPDAIAGSKIGSQAEWDSVMVPIPGSVHPIEMGAFYREDCSDASNLQAPNTGTAHLTRTKKESFEWSVDAVYLSAYNSDIANRYNPIIKAEITTA